MFDGDIIKVLKNHGTCLVNSTSPEQIARLEQLLNCKLKVREATYLEDGVIIEKVSEDDKR